MEVESIIAIAGIATTVYFAWHETREMVFPPAARWLLGLAGLSLLVGLTAGWQIDRSNAGIHPEWIGMARRVLSVELFVSTALFAVAIVVVHRATKQAEDVGPLRSPPLDAANMDKLPLEPMPGADRAVSIHVPKSRRRSDR